MDSEKKKVLVGAALFNWSETQRMITIADGLWKNGWQVYFAGKGPYERLIADKPYKRVYLQCDTWWYDQKHIDRMMDMGRYGGHIGSAKELEQVVNEEVALIREIQPDLMLTGYRMTFTASARICQTPLVWCMSAVMSQPFITALYQETKRRLSNQSGAVIENGEKECIFEDSFACGRLLGHGKGTIQDWNKLLEEHGRPRFKGDLMLYAGDLTLMADAPELFPDIRENKAWRFIGPILNYENYPVPEIKTDRKKVLISIGSSCGKSLLVLLLQAALMASDYEYYVTDVGYLTPEEKQEYPDNFHFYEKISLAGTAKQCDLALIHGGQGTIYNVLKEGCPAAAFPQAFEQRHNFENLIRNIPCGEMIYSKKTTKEMVHQVMVRILKDPSYKEAAEKAAKIIRKYDQKENLAQQNAVIQIERFLAEWEEKK